MLKIVLIFIILGCLSYKMVYVVYVMSEHARRSRGVGGYILAWTRQYTLPEFVDTVFVDAQLTLDRSKLRKLFSILFLETAFVCVFV